MNRSKNKNKADSNCNDASLRRSTATSQETSAQSKSDDKGGKSAPKSSRSYNDPSWWMQYPQLSANAGQIWFTQPLGKPIEESNIGDETRQMGAEQQNIRLKISKTPTAGVMAIDFVPTYGVTGTIKGTGYDKYDTTAVAVAANHLYWDIVHANSRNISYSANDLFQLLVNMDCIYMELTDAIRTYGLLSKYSVTNRYLCQTLIRACGWDFDSCVSDMANFRYMINRLIMLVNRIHIPRVYNIFAAHSANFTQVFTDADNEKCQFYVMRMKGYFDYDDARGITDYKPYVVNNLLQLKNVSYLHKIEDLVMKVLNSDYMGVMDGDILKRFGEENMFHLPEMPDNVATPITFDPEFLLKLANATFGSDDTKYGTNPNGNWPEYKVTRGAQSVSEVQITVRLHTSLNTSNIDGWARSFGTARNNKGLVVVNLPSGVEADASVLMVASRWMGVLEYGSYTYNADGYASVRSCGTEFLLGMEMYFINSDNSVSSCKCNGILQPDFTAVDSVRGSSIEVMRQLMQYSIMPPILIPTYTGTGEDADLLITYARVTPIDNYAAINVSEVEKMHYVAVVSIFERVEGTQYGFAYKNQGV